MQYISTRGTAPCLPFDEVTLAGLASDGGLYVPDYFPAFSVEEIRAFETLSYPELAVKVMTPYIGDAVPAGVLEALVNESYASFRHPDIAPLVSIGRDEYLLELFHGPTLAFKDFALQFLGRLLEYLLTQRNQTITVVGATSGDTGSAAIAGLAGRRGMEIFILHPQGRVSDVQRKQMTTVMDANVHNIAIEGTFDDCQAIVKQLFSDAAFRKENRLAAVNSINWARILAQIVYYFYAARGRERVSFSVPTGNFGDIYAGYVAKQMGLSVRKLVIASNANDILTRCFKTGEYKPAGVLPSLSPSMDIQISSNFERLLFDLSGRDANALLALMRSLQTDKSMTLPAPILKALHETFEAERVDDEGTLATIAEVYRCAGVLIDPHTAVGVAAGRRIVRPEGESLITLATAYPAKFPDAVSKATGVIPSLPEHLKGLMGAKERYTVLPADVAAVKQHIMEQ